jgi:ABC-2 type transport system ATP-binding protein
MLRIQELTKSYGRQNVLSGVDLSVEAGEIVALIGINGAGKSTLASVVAGLRTADRGAVTIHGIDARADPHAARQHLGLAAQDIGLYPTLTGRENLTFFGRLAGVNSQGLKRRIEDLAESLELTHFLNKRTETLSGGQRRRLHTAIAMLHRPGLLWLDEPTVGADIQSRQQLLLEIRRFAAEGNAVVYATHYFPEVETLGASVAVLHRGRIVARGSSESIIGNHALPSIALEFEGDLPKNLQAFIQTGGGPDVTRVVIPARRPAAELAQIVGNLGQATSRLRSVELHQPNLESAFLSITDEGRPADVEETVDVIAS